MSCRVTHYSIVHKDAERNLFAKAMQIFIEILLHIFYRHLHCHFADAFIQSDLQLASEKSPKLS